jgi:hypothetical protein
MEPEEAAGGIRHPCLPALRVGLRVRLGGARDRPVSRTSGTRGQSRRSGPIRPGQRIIQRASDSITARIRLTAPTTAGMASRTAGDSAVSSC